MTDPSLRNVIEALTAAYNEAAGEGLSIDETRRATLEVLDRFYAPAFEWTEAPSSFYPSGRRGGRQELEAAAEQVSALFGMRRYTLLEVIEEGDRAAARYIWEASFREGNAHVSIPMSTFYRFSEERIITINEYLCPEVSDQ